MEYDKEQILANIESELRSALSTYKFRPNNDIYINKIKDDVNRTVNKYLACNNSNYVLKSGDIIVEQDEYKPSVVNIVFSDELKKVLYKLDGIFIE